MPPKTQRLFWLSLFVKFGLALLVPLVSDEYYYWLWGQHPQMSYFDHPPMVGWIMILADPLSHISPGAIRWPFIALAQASIWMWLSLARSFLNEDRRHLLLWVLLLNPMTGWGGLVATPDIPLIFFWSLALWVCKRLLQKPTWCHYSLLGAALGLGFLSKYMIVVFIPCLALWIALDGHWKFLFSPKLAATLFLGLAFSLPVLYWNSQNQWVSFLFQWGHGTSGGPTQWKWPVEYLSAQFFIIFPVFFVLALKNSFRSRLLGVFAWVPLLFFLMTSFSARVEANWPMMAFPAVYVLSLLELKSSKIVRACLSLWAVILVVVLSTPLWYPQRFGAQYPLKVFEAENFAPMLPLTDSHLPIFVDNYQKASYLSFKKQDLICKLPGIGRPDFFSFLSACGQLPKEFLFVTDITAKPNFRSAYPQYEIKGEVSKNDKFVSYRVGLR